MVEKPSKSEKRGKKEKRDGKDGKKGDKDTKDIECFVCGWPHYANKCPTKDKNNKDSGDSDLEERHSHVTWHASTFATYQVLNVSQENVLGEYDILLDSQANISIMRSNLLCDIQEASE